MSSDDRRVFPEIKGIADKAFERAVQKMAQVKVETDQATQRLHDPHFPDCAAITSLASGPIGQ